MIEPFKIFESFADELAQGITKEMPEGFVMMKQVHGDQIHWLKTKPQTLLQGDALITRAQGIPLAIQVADCQGILIYDPKAKTIAAVHSGWRGSAQNILGKTIKKLIAEDSRPQDLWIGISPSLGPCCAEFTDPKKELPSSCHPFIKGRKVDFWGLSFAQALAAFVPQNQIEIAQKCTRCHPDGYYSHRKGDIERMVVFIGLK